MQHQIKITLLTMALLALVSWAASQSLANDTYDKAHETVDGWEIIFDGTSTDALRGWKTDKFPSTGWALEEDGSLHALDGSQDIITRNQYAEFDLRLDWKLSKGANSGVMYRVAEQGGHPHDTGPEYQIIDDPRVHPSSSGSLYALIKPNEKAKIKPAGQWNTSRIVIQDNRVQHYLNDELIVEYVWGSEDIKKRIEKSKFRKWKGFMQQDTGHIGFQSHGKDLWFRNIKIKDLSAE